MGLNKTVYVLQHEIPYEGQTLIGIFSNEEAAIRTADLRLGRHDEPGDWLEHEGYRAPYKERSIGYEYQQVYKWTVLDSVQVDD